MPLILIMILSYLIINISSYSLDQCSWTLWYNFCSEQFLLSAGFYSRKELHLINLRLPSVTEHFGIFLPFHSPLVFAYEQKLDKLFPSFDSVPRLFSWDFHSSRDPQCGSHNSLTRFQSSLAVRMESSFGLSSFSSQIVVVAIQVFLLLRNTFHSTFCNCCLQVSHFVSQIAQFLLMEVFIKIQTLYLHLPASTSDFFISILKDEW